MRTADFDYALPPELIAQTPAEQRDASRLFVVRRATGTFQHRRFPDLLEHLGAGDVLVLNNSRVASLMEICWFKGSPASESSRALRCISNSC